MSRQRTTRTKTTEGSYSRRPKKSNQTRREIAAEAARIIATEGQSNYQAAKKKAADRIGVSHRVALPSNLEVQDALLRYQSLYGGDQHKANLQRLRKAALSTMERFAHFSPRLVGPVLEGTAGIHSRISLHVFCEPAENLILHFLENHIPFSQEERPIRWHDGQTRVIPIFVIDLCEAKSELAVFSPMDRRQAPPSPIDGKPQKRANKTDVARLIEQLQDQVLLR